MPGTEIATVFVVVSTVGASMVAVTFSSDIAAVVGPVESLCAHPMAKARPMSQANRLIVKYSNHRGRVNGRRRGRADYADRDRYSNRFSRPEKDVLDG